MTQRYMPAKRHRMLLLPLLLLAVAGVFLVVSNIFAADHSGNGRVELDGNVHFDGNTNADWDTICRAVPGVTTGNGYIDVQSSLPTNISPAVCKGDSYFTSTGAFGADNTYFASNKDIEDISGTLTGTAWGCVNVNNPTPKDEIFNAYTAQGTLADNTKALFFGFERGQNNGTEFQGVWYLKNSVGCTAPATGQGAWSGGPHASWSFDPVTGAVRQTCDATGNPGAGTSPCNGDLLVIANHASGGQNTTIRVGAWDPGQACNNLDCSVASNKKLASWPILPLEGNSLPAPAGRDCDGTHTCVFPNGEGSDCQSAQPSNEVCATSNDPVFNPTSPTDGCINTPWLPASGAPNPCTTGGKGSSTPILDSYQFVEGWIDLQGLFGELPCFSTVVFEARTSAEFTATLKDYAFGSFNTCQSAITTTIKSSGTTVTEVPKGTTVNDTATVTGTGGVNAPTGTVTFHLYSDKTCTTEVTTGGWPQSVNLSTGTTNGLSVTVASQTTTANTPLSFAASYSGDGLYPPAALDTANGCEPLSVGTSSITTTIKKSGSTVTEVPKGTTVNDTATVTGAGDGTTAPTGTVTFHLYSDKTCGTEVTTGGWPQTVNLSTGTTNGLAVTVASQTTTANAPLSFAASYSGDGLYPAAALDTTNGCEPLSVGTSSITTTIKSSGSAVTEVPKGTTVNDTATVTGAGDGTSAPTGTATFHLYSDNSCTTEITTGGWPQTVNLSTGTTSGLSVTVASQTTTANAPLSFAASYSGDSVYPAAALDTTNGCEPLNVGTSSITTTIKSSGSTVTEVPKGTTVNDTATVTGAGDGTTAPTGTVTFHLYSDKSCGTEVTTGGWPQTVNLNTGTTIGLAATVASQTTTANAPLSFAASYSGDGLYPAAALDTTNGCEPLDVGTSSVVTHIIRDSDSADITGTNVIIGTIMHDTATVTGAGDGSSAPTGTVSFHFYSDTTCTTEVSTDGAGNSWPQTVNLSTGTANGTAVTVSARSLAAPGSLSFAASYSGDSTYPAVALDTVNGCEPLSIVNPSTRLAISDQITNLPSDATGTVTYQVFTDDQCSVPVSDGTPSDGDVTPANNNVGAGGIAPWSDSYIPSGSGTFYVKATFTGNGTYAGVVFSDCTEHVVITE